jgi:multidrug efflux pump subunit AcrA (membrane-fusion protein)
VLVASLTALAVWVYDTGRRMAGFDHSEAGQITSELRAANASLEEEVARLRSLLTASQSSQQIEQSAQQLMAEQNKALVNENSRLKEELAVFERLTKLEGGKAEGEITLDRLAVRSDMSPGRYRFSFLIALQGAKRGKETKLNLQLVVASRGATTNAKITLPRHDDPDVAQYDVSLRNFKRVEGKFEVPANFTVGAVEIRILEAGVLKASKSLTL